MSLIPKTIVCISDTHLNHGSIVMPEGDILIHAGDFTYGGMEDEVTNFSEWLAGLKYQYKVVIAGNHEMEFEKSESIRNILTPHCIYLEHSYTVIEGIKIFGTPIQPVFYGMAYNCEDKERSVLFEEIPTDTDILITHSPPFGILDTIYNGTSVGDKLMRNLLNKSLKPKLHVFGHIHESYGKKVIGGTTFINAAICTLQYKPENKPQVYKYLTDSSSGDSADKCSLFWDYIK